MSTVGTEGAGAPFADSGEMRTRAREFDWASTPLGSADRWPQSLRTAAALVLAGGFPMAVLWGPELVQIYNDACAPFFGAKHPSGLGQATRECWPEVWHINGPIYARVRAGETVTLEEAHHPLKRRGPDGPVEDLYFTLSYSPVLDDHDQVGGVLVTVMDMTARVVGRATVVERDRLEHGLHVALLDSAQLLEQVSDSYLLMDRDFRIVAVNQSAERMLHRTRDTLIGLTHSVAFPALSAEEPERQYRRVAAEHVEAHFTNHYVGEGNDLHLEIDAYPARDGGVAVFWRDISERIRLLAEAQTARVEAEARTAVVQQAAAERERLLSELDAERTLLRTVLDRLPAAVFVVEAPSGRVLALNDAVARVWGAPRPHTTSIENYSTEWVGYHLDGRQIASEEWPVARAALGETVVNWTGEIERADGTRALIEVSAAPVRDATGHTVAAVAVAADITARAAAAREREHLLRELQVERARLAYVFQQAPTFLAVVREPTHIFQLANDAYYQLVGQRDLIGRPVSEALPEAVEQGFVKLLDHVLATGEPYVGREVEIVLTRAVGGEPEARFVDFVYLPLVEADGSRSGIIAHGTDVTEQVQARREIERLLVESERARTDAENARAEAEAANRSKGEFLAVMSHELRTPLNAIGGYAELLDMGLRGPVTELQRADLARIQKSQRHLLGLINGVLNYAKVDAGSVHFDVADVALDEVLYACEALIAPQADAKGISLSFDACHAPVCARGDREKVEQIVLNLLSNAVKFTDPGGRVTLSCGHVGVPDDLEPRVAIHVKDTGRGIVRAQLERVFQPFVQVDSKLTRTEEGTGLGLAISRDLARGMGGDITVESTAGVGSTFTLVLPRGV